MRGGALRSAVRTAGGPTLGFVSVGVSGFVLLASGPRLLGTAEYSLLAVAWTLTTIVGVGLAQPGEQTVTRVVAGGGHRTVSRTVELRLLVLVLASMLLPLLAIRGVSPLFSGSVLWASSVVVGMLGWALVAGPRGELAGVSDFHTYGGVLGVEAVARTLLCLAAWLLPGSAAVLLAAAIGVPTLVGAAAARLLKRRHPAVEAPDAPDLHRREHGVMTLVALLSQVALSTAPLWLQAQSPDLALAGAFVTATSYLRVPVLFIGGLAAVALAAVSTSVAAGDIDSARRQSVRSIGGAVAIGAIAAAGLLVLSGPLLRVFYGQEIDLGPGVLVVMAVTTVLAIAAGMATQVLYGARRGASVLAAWTVVAGGTTLALAVTGGSALAAATAVALGQAVAIGLLGVTLVRTLRAGPTGGQARSATTSI